MSFAAPFFAWIGVAAALATVALHLLAWRRPPPTPLPTARFAPERPVRMVSRAMRPTDLPLLALRVLLVLLVAFALAGPTFARRERGTARVVVVDRSRATVPGTELLDATHAAFRPGDALVLFDSVAREVPAPSADSVRTDITHGARGSISAALVAAVRAARRLERGRDSVEIVVISPFAADELDAATGAIRQQWHGRVTRVRAGAAPNEPRPPGRPDVRAPAGDPVAAALALAGELPGGGAVRVARDTVTAADTAWASGGRVLVVWPSALAGWPRHAPADTAFAVTVLGGTGPPGAVGTQPATVVAPFARSTLPPDGRVIARWNDGLAAVTEQTLGSGCLRAVAIAVPGAGDLALSPAFRNVARRLAGPCATAGDPALASDSVVAIVLPERPLDAAPTARAAIAVPAPPSRLTAWLLALALLAALVEMRVRRGESHAGA